MMTAPQRHPRHHDFSDEMAEIVGGLLSRFRLTRLLRHHDHVIVLALFSGLNGFISIALIATVALFTQTPLIFPSLGPTAFLLFYTPTAASATPRATIIGHAVSIIAGYGSLLLTGLAHAGPATAEGVTWPRVLAAALALGLTTSVMVLLRAPHPPACATALIIALGIITAPAQLGVLMLGVIALLAQALLINRLAGITYPWWGGPARP